MTGVEQRREACFLDHLVERIGETVVREEPLHVGVELESTDAVVDDQTTRLVDPAPALVRVDAGERDQHVGVRPRYLGDLLVRYPRLPCDRLRVDGEDHGHHAALAIVVRQLERCRPRGLAAEVEDRCFA